MLALRFAAVLGLVFWIGGLAVLGGIAAPAMFDVLGARGAEGRALAGTAFGEAFGRFHTVAYVCGAAIIASLAARGVLGPRPRHFSLRLIVLLLMVTSAAWSGLVLVPRMQEAQPGGVGSPSALAADDARRGQFARLHRLASALQIVPMLGGLALLFFELKD